MHLVLAIHKLIVCVRAGLFDFFPAVESLQQPRQPLSRCASIDSKDRLRNSEDESRDSEDES